MFVSIFTFTIMGSPLTNVAIRQREIPWKPYLFCLVSGYFHYIVFNGIILRMR